jgi:hypothetical protein
MEDRASKQAHSATGRLASLDAYRGFVILLMLTQMLGLSRVAANFPDSPAWRLIAFHP